MKSIEFNEDQLPDLQALGAQLFCDEKDPRSVAYVRVLKRPKISWWRICLATLLPVLLAVLLAIGIYHRTADRFLSWICPIAALLLYAIVFAKRAALCLVRIYQRYAPDRVRNKCRYEPSCSEYAILAIRKYGLIRGVGKSIKRLKRCNINGGGIEYP